MSHPIVELIKKADKAIVEEDFDSLMAFYTLDAILVIEPGKNAVGKQAIRQAFESIALYFRNGLRVYKTG